MRRSRFSETQILGVLNEADAGRSVSDLSREHGISESTFYRWKSRYSNVEAQEAALLRQLEDENRRLKQLVAEQSLDIQALKTTLGKKSMRQVRQRQGASSSRHAS